MQCLVCNSALKKLTTQGDRNFCECPRCGSYSLSNSCQAVIAGDLERRAPTGWAIVSHALYRMTKQQQWAMLSTEVLKNILDNTELPRPQKQLENLILWLGEAQPNMGGGVRPEAGAEAAVGAVNASSFGFLVNQALDAGLLKGQVVLIGGETLALHPIQLTMSGWQLFDELQRGKSASRTAFMAMQFGETELDRIYKDHFKVGVAVTGFDLKRVDEGQPAGLIDDLLRVKIRQSRFLIADLTHQNSGAYWEAGYAEGLGKPVIYTCSKDVFEDKTKGTHFDTNHHLTVVWERDRLGDAVERLKATIRATLPDESKFDA